MAAECLEVAINYKVPNQNLMDALGKSFRSGDVISLFQAFYIARNHNVPLPSWAIKEAESVFSLAISDKAVLGDPGRGNRALGRYRKQFIRAVRASAYRNTLAWIHDIKLYDSVPTYVIQLWYDGFINWEANLGYGDAARYVNNALKGTAFQGGSIVIRRASYGIYKAPSRFRHEIERELGLRGRDKIFGLPSTEQPKHISELIKKHSGSK